MVFDHDSKPYALFLYSLFAKMASLSGRHVAYNRCRMRKVKCDGRTPWCKRCSGTGAEFECCYETKRKSSTRQETSPSPSPPTRFAQNSSLSLVADPCRDSSWNPISLSPQDDFSNKTTIPIFPPLDEVGFDASLFPKCPESLSSFLSPATQVPLVEPNQPRELSENDIISVNLGNQHQSNSNVQTRSATWD